MQRRILDALRNVEREFPGAWVLRSGLVSPKEGQRVERSDRSSTRRAINGLAGRGLVELKEAAYGEHGVQSVVRLINEDRPPLMSPEQDLKIRMKLDPDLRLLNDALRSHGSRVRVDLVDAEKVERTTVLDLQTRTSYRAVYLV
ncbi:hypothetical protein H180DRAFT_00751 [Streptomyces sp. WMMB 322]|nr:hypothetical protein H180DRAFT_00751 [Streptomyces sp. WMMB 322]